MQLNIKIVAPIIIAAVIFGAALYFLGERGQNPMLDDYDGDASSLSHTEDGAADTANTAGTAEAPGVPGTAAETPPPGSIALGGLVLHEITLEPLADVAVTLCRIQPGYMAVDPVPIAETRSAADGTYCVHALPSDARQTSLAFAKEGFVSEQLWDPISQSMAELPVTHLAPGIKVTGEVVTADGKPVSGGLVYGVDELALTQSQGWYGSTQSVSVVYANWEAMQTPSWKVDSGGRFTIYLHSGTATVQASIPGFAPAFCAPFELSATEQQHVRIVVTEGKSFQAIVKDEEGKPIAGARVSVQPIIPDREPDRNFAMYRAQNSAVSGADGSITISGLPEEITGLNVAHDRYLPFNDWQFRRKTEGVPHEITLKAGQYLTGKFLFADGSPPAVGVCTVLANNQQLAQFPTNADGSFRTDPMPRTLSSASLDPAHALPKDVSWEAGPGEHGLGTIICDAGKSLAVKVVDAKGEPVKRASINCMLSQTNQSTWTPYAASLPSAVTGDDGLAKLSGFPTGQFTAHVSGRGFAPADEEFSFGTADPTASLQVTLAGEARVFLTVHDAAGNGMLGVRGQIAEADGQTNPNVQWVQNPGGSRSDASGRMAIPGVKSEAALTLTLNAHDFAPTEVKIEPLTPGETRDLGTITLESGSSITGVVLDTGGATIANAGVQVQPDYSAQRGRFSGMSIERTVRSDSAGRFTITGLQQGKYWLSANAAGYTQAQSKSVSVESGDLPGVTITLAAGQVYEGVVVNDDGTPSPQVSMSIGAKDGSGSANATTDAEGHFRITNAPGGEVTLWVSRWRQDGNNFQQTFEADAVNGLPKKIVIPTGGVIEFTVKMLGERAAPASVTYSLTPVEQPGKQRYYWGGGENAIELKDGGGKIEGVQAGNYQLVLNAIDFPPTEARAVEIVSGKSVRVEFAFDGTRAAVAIHVQDQDAAPVAGALVWVVSEGAGKNRGRVESYSYSSGGGSIPQGYGGSGQGTTDAEGVYNTYLIGSDPVTVTVQANGFAPASIESANSRVTASGLLVTLDAESAFVVTVLDTDGGPLDGASVNTEKVVPETQPKRGRRGQRYFGGQPGGQTKNGVTRVGGLTAGNYKVHIYGAGELLGTLEESLGTSEEKSLQFQRKPPLVVTGVVRLNGEPPGGGTVTLAMNSGQKQAPVDADGAFEVEVAAGGDCTVSFQTVDNISLSGKSLKISESTHLDLDFEVVSLTGRVLLPDGQPARNISGGLSGASWMQINTDDNGKFSIASLSPGTYTWNFGNPPQGAFAPTSQLEVTGVTDAVYKFEQGIKLTMVFVGEIKPAQAWVWHIAADGSRTNVPIESGNSQTSEGMVLKWPANGVAGMVQADNSFCAYFKVEPGQKRVEVALRAGGNAFISILDKEGKGQPRQRYEIRNLGNSEDPGQWESTGKNGQSWVMLQEGNYQAIVTFPSGSKVTKEFSITAGQQEQVEIKEE